MEFGTREAEPDHDEGVWAYLSVAGGRVADPESLRVELAGACRRGGLAPYRPPSIEPPHLSRSKDLRRELDAIGEAMAVIIDVSDANPRLAAELATAHSEQRPVLALRHRDAEPPAIVDALLSSELVRTVIWIDSRDCVTQVESTFADPDWRRLLRAGARGAT